MDAQRDDKDATFHYIDYYQSSSWKDLSFEQKNFHYQMISWGEIQPVSPIDMKK